MKVGYFRASSLSSAVGNFYNSASSLFAATSASHLARYILLVRRKTRSTRHRACLSKAAVGFIFEGPPTAVSTLYLNLHTPAIATQTIPYHLQQVMGALEAAGYRTSGMHKEPLALKTDAPDAAVWDVLRCWARDNAQPAPVRAAGLAILGRGTQLIAGADFEADRASVERNSTTGRAAQGKGGFLHAHNPEQDWGPLARRSVMARGENGEESAESPAMFSSE